MRVALARALRETILGKGEHLPELADRSIEQGLVVVPQAEERTPGGGPAKRLKRSSRREHDADHHVYEHDARDVHACHPEITSGLPDGDLRLAGVVGAEDGGHVVEVMQPDRPLVRWRVGHRELQAQKGAARGGPSFVKPFSAR